jgi:hypothetical protein
MKPGDEIVCTQEIWCENGVHIRPGTRGLIHRDSYIRPDGLLWVLFANGQRTWASAAEMKLVSPLILLAECAK